MALSLLRSLARFCFFRNKVKVLIGAEPHLICHKLTLARLLPLLR
ncbi:MAG: hypothetical protein QOG17_2392, partial [Gammaproteobacteria bacterium]|nr:hypothetical protein [Gammaproteobacteria bacterium]